MSRLRRTLSALAVLLAIGAVAAGAAQATPEYFTCVKATPKKTGNYGDKECAVRLEGEEAGTGKYERSSEVVGTKVTWKTETAVISTPALGGKVTCKGGTMEAEVVSSTETEADAEFQGCETEGKPCNSSGAGKGHVVLNPATTWLVGRHEDVYVELGATGGVGNYLAEFECEGLLIRVKGFTDGLIAEPETERVSALSTLVFAEEEELRTEVSIDGGLEWIGEELGGFPSEANTVAHGKSKPALGFTGGEGGGGAIGPHGSITGVVSNDAAPPAPIQDAAVMACEVVSHSCYTTGTDSEGRYELASVRPGNYVITVYPPTTLEKEARVEEFAVVAEAETTENVTLAAPVPPPPGTHVSGVGEQEGVPVINWMVEAPIETEACVGGVVTATVTARNTTDGKIETKGPVTLTETPTGSGIYVGKLPAVYPDHGAGTITITVTGCPNPADNKVFELSAYIDPSGVVVDGDHGDAPVAGATVTLLSSESLYGAYAAVPDGSAVMSPANRTNPDETNGDGEFGWDTLAGFYEVEATKAGCGSATTAAFAVPPPQTELRLVLHCETPLRIDTETLPAASIGLPYEVQLVASGGQEPYKWKKAAPLPKGLKLSKTGLLAGTPSEKLEPGEYAIEVLVRDKAKPKHVAGATLTLAIS